MKILGIDPGLQHTGWGIIESEGNRLIFIAAGTIDTDPKRSLPDRLVQIDEGLCAVIADHQPVEAGLEETFMNNNPASALKLGLARGVAMVVPARLGVKVSGYAANLVKKSVVGAGHADKTQVQMMIKTLLPQSGKLGADAADALAIAICHAHHRASAARVATALEKEKDRRHAG
ncbi:MAG: crossover junction endodeoxyribonuclease RuvC [Pseudomonadota bacterium]